MTQNLIALMLSLLITAASCAQTVNNNFRENISESERVINNKRAKEKTVSVSAKKPMNETYEYVFHPAARSGISVSLESENPRLGFMVLYKDQNISGTKLLQSWRMDKSANDSLVIRVYLKGASTGDISFKLRIVQT